VSVFLKKASKGPKKMEVKKIITDFSITHYKVVTGIMVVFTLILGGLIPLIEVDTDPENMLSEDEAVRVFHDETKERFALSDIVVVGIVNNKHAHGIFNPESLAKIFELTEFAKDLRWEDKEHPGKEIGVVEIDLLAPSTVDDISQGGPGTIKLEWLMKSPPTTQEQALEIKQKAFNNPLLKGSIVAEDGKAICLYLPLTSKDLSYKVYTELKKKIAEFSGDEQFHITGLPVAEDTFGVEMFIQMAISAPAAMLVIFILMLIFFRKLVLIISPMIVAMVSVISTMGLLIGLGYPVHIMSSMIPIFLMPIAVVDSVHILSEFFDLYTKEKGRKATIIEVMDNLFTPMLYTSLTSAAGFASLALTPIPPVQVFGVFVATGIMIAWVCTVTFVPAYVMMIKESSLENFGHEAQHTEKQNWLTKMLHGAGSLTYKGAKPIVIVLLVVSAIAIYGITQIEINDNPVKWFSKSHPIRQADIELNKHFGGTYMAYLVLDDASDSTADITEYVNEVRNRLVQATEGLSEEFPRAEEVVPEMEKLLLEAASNDMTKPELLEKLSEIASEKADTVEDEKSADVWYELADLFEVEKETLKIFKQPEVLEYISGLQSYLKQTGIVGKSNSVADIVKKVHQEIIDGQEANYRIPSTAGMVAECLMQFQGGHKPNDLWHLVAYDYSSANLWIQLTSGDNKDMEKVVKAVEKYFDDTPPPVPLYFNWAGLTYINTVWQDKMVFGMLQSFMGSFIIVFIMMAVLFRSPMWGIICMIPLTITILVIYGIIGLIGKDYDMPVAVLSALTLGMAVDFAIHFLERARESYSKTGSWQKSTAEMFTEPARAISRNVLVIAIGFLPLLAAPLVPYKTVGIFLCAIMALSGTVTLIALPAVVKIAEKKLFKPLKTPVSASCNCGFCIIISIAASVLIALNLQQYWNLTWNKLALISIIIIPVMALVCGALSRRKACKRNTEKEREA
jgi:predicted RND superfamily exporter protein